MEPRPEQGHPWGRPKSKEKAVDRIEKRELVAGLNAILSDTSLLLVTRNGGMTVAEVNVLRNRMREAGATYRVTKNRLALRAIDGTSFHGIAPLLKGPTALAWSKDAVSVAKTAVEFARTNEKLTILGAALAGRMLDPSGVKALAELPSLDTLRAGILGLLMAPATRIAGVLQAPAGQLARVLSAYAKASELPPEGPGGAAEAA